MSQRWARPWFAVTAACVAAGIVIQLIVSANSSSFFGGSSLGRALNVFAFFTIQSNVIVGATCLLLALRPHRASSVFAVFRLTGLIAITVTFIVFHVALSRLLDLDTLAQVANQLQHTVVPIMAVVGWLAFGPRGLTSRRVATLTIVFPLLYVIFTMIRGPLSSDFYPYPFVDVKALGYPRVALNGVWIAILFIGIAAAATVVDRRLSDDRSDPDRAP